MDQVKIIGQNTHDPSGTTPVRVDEEAEALCTIDTIHTRIHKGQLYSGDLYSASLANAASLQCLIRVTDTAHLRARGACGGDALFQFFSGPTTSADGSAISDVRNRNRFSADSPTVAFFSGPTVSANGTLLERILIPGGSGVMHSGGGDASTFNEFILPPGDYLASLTNNSGSSQPSQIQFDFYQPERAPS